MKDEKSAIERLCALENLVGALHISTKDQLMDEPTLVDKFYQFVGLAESFKTDCETYIQIAQASKMSVGLRIENLVMNISAHLFCTRGHLRDAEDRLGTTILTQIATQMMAANKTVN